MNSLSGQKLTQPTAGASPDLPDPKHIAQFARAEAWLFRGDQPDQEGYRWLAERGVTTIVNLRMHNLDDHVAASTDKLRSVHIPIFNDRAPSDEQALRFLKLCHDRNDEDVIFVHCRGGKGRTSLFCALVRVAQGWSLEAAITEQRSFGFEPEGEHKAQASFLRDFCGKLSSGTIHAPKL